MNYEIRRNRVPAYNDTRQNVIAERRFNTGKPILLNPMEYTAAIESATVDLSQVILDTDPQYEIMIFCNLKEGDNPNKPAGLEYGPNLFKFPGELTDVQQFTRWLEDVLIKTPQPFNLGLFELNSDDYFQYTLRPNDKMASFDSGYFKVYFNEPLCRILDGFYSNSVEVYNDQIFKELLPMFDTNVSQISTVFRLNKIESLLFVTTLPITETQVLDARLNNSVNYSLIGSVELNAAAFDLRAKGDWRYIPTLLRHYTMNQAYEINNYMIGVLIQYNNTSLRQHTLGPGERFIANLAFFPRQGVDV